MSHRLLELTLAARDCQDAGSRNLGQTFPVITVSNLIYQTLLSVKPWKQTAGRKYSRIFRAHLGPIVPSSVVRSFFRFHRRLSLFFPTQQKGEFLFAASWAGFVTRSGDAETGSVWDDRTDDEMTIKREKDRAIEESRKGRGRGSNARSIDQTNPCFQVSHN